MNRTVIPISASTGVLRLSKSDLRCVILCSREPTYQEEFGVSVANLRVWNNPMWYHLVRSATRNGYGIRTDKLR
jgi:hypothetical protein